MLELEDKHNVMQGQFLLSSEGSGKGKFIQQLQSVAPSIWEKLVCENRSHDIISQCSFCFAPGIQQPVIKLNVQRNITVYTKRHV